ncbi:MAG: hypothetical protein JST46_06465 [Bacteroidetes bacterium]|nr:hypothetical protein [Bacteroidota bacterium]
MNSRVIILAFVMMACAGTALAQKIKYKDLFVLLNNRQFDDAEPFLKKYLATTTDNPNAYLFMGLIYQDKAEKLDMLRETTKTVTWLDSAVYFYQKASKGINEKEIDKNEEYYQMYNRRDIRTGKFGVKLSDVQLDLEARMKLKSRAKSIENMKSQFLMAEKFYNKTKTEFVAFQKSHPTLGDLYVRADERSMDSLKHLAHLYDSSLINFNDYKATASSLGKTGHNQVLDPREINDYTKDGRDETDFYKDDLKVWDYKRWALSSLEVIEKEIVPMKNSLVAVDVEINKVQQKLKKDSVAVWDDIKLLRTKISFPGLLKIDPQPLPLEIFEMKLGELSYGSQVAGDRAIRDSANLVLQVESLRKQVSLSGKLDSLARVIQDKKDLGDKLNDYQHFIKAGYGTSDVLVNLVRSTHEFAAAQKQSKEAQLLRKEQSLKWMVSTTDSIPLIADNGLKSNFKPVLITDKFTAGLQFADSVATGYFTFIEPSRKIKSKVSFPVPATMTKRMLPFIKGLTTADDKTNVEFVLLYSESKSGEKYASALARIGRKEGLVWSVNADFDLLPQEMVYNPETSELSVKTRNGSGEWVPVIFDKVGKIVK